MNRLKRTAAVVLAAAGTQTFCRLTHRRGRRRRRPKSAPNSLLPPFAQKPTLSQSPTRQISCTGWLIPVQIGMKSHNQSVMRGEEGRTAIVMVASQKGGDHAAVRVK